MKCVDRPSRQGVVVGKQVVQYLIIGVPADGHESNETVSLLSCPTAGTPMMRY